MYLDCVLYLKKYSHIFITNLYKFEKLYYIWNCYYVYFDKCNFVWLRVYIIRTRLNILVIMPAVISIGFSESV